MMAIFVKLIKEMENEIEVRYRFQTAGGEERGLLSLNKETAKISIIIPIRNEFLTKRACYAAFRELRDFRELSKKKFPEITSWES